MRNPVTTTDATKRTIASDIARLYDPCGYLACDWDDKVSGELAHKWHAFGSKMNQMEQLCIPRWLNTDVAVKKQLHAFADASLQSYGCAFYIRQENSNRTVSTDLVFTKSRVAPVKDSTIPKLEFNACHLMAELVDTVRKAHDIEMDSCYFGSHSMIAIHWIAKSPLDVNICRKSCGKHTRTNQRRKSRAQSHYTAKISKCSSTFDKDIG